MTIQNTGLQMEDDPEADVDHDVTVLDRIQEILNDLGLFATTGKKLKALVQLAILIGQENARVLPTRLSDATDTTDLDSLRAEVDHWRNVANAATMYLPEPERTAVRTAHGFQPVPNLFH